MDQKFEDSQNCGAVCSKKVLIIGIIKTSQTISVRVFVRKLMIGLKLWEPENGSFEGLREGSESSFGPQNGDQKYRCNEKKPQ